MSNLDAGYLAILYTLLLKITWAMPSAWRDHRAKNPGMEKLQSIAIACGAYGLCIMIAHVGCTAVYLILCWLTS